MTWTSLALSQRNWNTTRKGRITGLRTAKLLAARRTDMAHRNCNQCGNEYYVIPSKLETSKYCSKKCKWETHGWSSEPNTTCTGCGKAYHVKESQKKRFKRTIGHFCSNLCFATHKRNSGVYDGNKNPNYRKREEENGYPLREYTTAGSRVNGLRRMKLHQAVCCEV